jgi:acyl carrier protein
MGLDAVEIIMRLEDEFGIEIPEASVELKTVGELSTWLAERSPHRRSTEVWRTVQRIVAECLCLSDSEVRPESRWIEDLCVD